MGLITGPSGCGKTTVARALFGVEALRDPLAWGAGAVLDDFPARPLNEIADICQAVGFNTIPAWLRPFAVLSNGEQFRAMLARRLLETPARVVLDEFTSVVDRQVAKIGAHAVQKYVRAHDTQFVAISCHHDIIDWLNPDWILEPATMQFAWRALRRRPALDVTIGRVEHALWRHFAAFHYMTAELSTSAQCFALAVEGRPVVFGGMLYRPVSHGQKRPIWGLSRIVTLPDFQGLGLAFVLMDTLGAAFSACEQYMHTYPAHPGLTRAFDRSPHWQLQRKPGLITLSGQKSASGRPLGGGRPNAVFRYVGPAQADSAQARAFLDIPSLRASA